MLLLLKTSVNENCTDSLCMGKLMIDVDKAEKKHKKNVCGAWRQPKIFNYHHIIM